MSNLVPERERWKFVAQVWRSISIATPVLLAGQVIDDRRVHAVRYECRAGVIEMDELLATRGLASQARDV